MRAIVLERKGKEAAVLREDGVVVKLRTNRQVGEEFSLEEQKLRMMRPGMRALAAAAAVVLLLTGTGGFYSYSYVQACSYVTVDVNPSLEIVLNRQDKVISVSALNDDAQEVVDRLMAEGIRNKSLTEVVSEAEEILSSLSYLEDDADLLFSVSSKEEKHKHKLMDELSAHARDLGSEEHEKKLSVEIEEGSMKLREEAKGQGVSTGRYIHEQREEGKMPPPGDGKNPPPDGEGVPPEEGKTPPESGKNPLPDGERKALPEEKSSASADGNAL